jgi:hypothetical protein
MLIYSADRELAVEHRLILWSYLRREADRTALPNHLSMSSGCGRGADNDKSSACFRQLLDPPRAAAVAAVPVRVSQLLLNSSPLGTEARMWSPTSSILIHGERDAILVDTPATTAQATALADWVEKSGKNLTTIYTTHGHGDHFFGNGILLERFRGAKAIAAPKVSEIMRKQTSQQVMAGLWNKRFPGLIPKNIVFAEQLEGDTLCLEGHELVVVDVGQRRASIFCGIVVGQIASHQQATEGT